MNSIRTIYVTESGCDLMDVFPDIAEFDRRSRDEGSWYDLVCRNPVDIKVAPYKVVVTTNAELEKIHAAMGAQHVDNLIEMFIEKVNNLPQQSRTMNALVDAIVDFITVNCDNSNRMEVGDRLCEKMVNLNLVVQDAPPPLLATAPLEMPLFQTFPLEMPVFPTIDCVDYYGQFVAATQHTMSILQSINTYSLLQTLYCPLMAVPQTKRRKWIQSIANNLDTSSIKIKTKPLLDTQTFRQASRIPA